MKWERNCKSCGKLTGRGRGAKYCLICRPKDLPRDLQQTIIQKRIDNYQCPHCGRDKIEWIKPVHDTYCSSECLNNLGYIEV